MRRFASSAWASACVLSIAAVIALCEHALIATFAVDEFATREHAAVGPLSVYLLGAVVLGVLRMSAAVLQRRAPSAMRTMAAMRSCYILPIVGVAALGILLGMESIEHLLMHECLPTFADVFGGRPLLGCLILAVLSFVIGGTAVRATRICLAVVQACLRNFLTYLGRAIAKISARKASRRRVACVVDRCSFGQSAGLRAPPRSFASFDIALTA